MPDDTYWLNLPATTADKSKSAFPFLALVEHTNYLPREYYGGDHIIYCGDYVKPTHEYFQLSEAALVERFLPALKQREPGLPARLDSQVVGLARALRPASAGAQSQPPYTRHQDAAAGAVLGEHVASLSLGSRHQLRRRDWPARCPYLHDRTRVRASPANSPSHPCREINAPIARLFGHNFPIQD